MASALFLLDLLSSLYFAIRRLKRQNQDATAQEKTSGPSIHSVKRVGKGDEGNYRHSLLSSGVADVGG